MRNLTLLACLLMAGCATPVTMQATGGSRADGTVTLAYEYGLFEKPIVDPAQGQASAVQKCKAWGYKDAEAFGAGQAECVAVNGYGDCVQTRINVNYQCLGSPK